MKPFFTVIMASTLAEYKGAASNRKEKIVRAIESLRSQTFVNWELIVVADGCMETFNLVTDKYSTDERIDCLLIDKQKIWSGEVRNVGHQNAKGEYCLYLDNDDKLGKDHLLKIAHHILKLSYPSAVFFNDMVNNSSNNPKERICKLIRGKCGTSNIAFKTSLPVSWKDSTYLHDWRFIQELLPFGIKEIGSAEYIVCHIPAHPKLDV